MSISVTARLQSISPLHGRYRDEKTAGQLGSEALVAMLARRITVKVARGSPGANYTVQHLVADHSRLKK